MAPIKKYELNQLRVLDIGCKRHLMYEIKKIIPEIKVYGIDISRYAIKASKKLQNNFLFTMLQRNFHSKIILI